MTAETLYEDAHLRVVHRRGRSPFTLVTFGEAGLRPEHGYWAQPEAEALDLDCIGFVAKAANWYPALAMDPARAAIQGIGQPVRIGYGNGMGGHAVLKYGQRLRLARGLAVSPQDSIDPAERPEDPRFHAHFRPDLHAGMAVAEADLPPWCVVLGDPHDPAEAPHLRRLAALTAAEFLPLPFLGPWATWMLAGGPALNGALRCALAADLPGLRRLLKRQRWDSRIWCTRLGGQALRQGRDALAERLLARAAALGTE
ncbi:hypothetical protein CKO45_29540, partial [Paracraurococcus ruber]|nr:hypothetical protein [Paracraurococcus ruber]